MDEVFALLDDSHATREQRTSRLYTGFVREHRCIDPAVLDTVWACVEADLAQGLHAVLLGDYEWGAKLLRAGDARLAADDRASLRMLMFRDCTRLSADEADAWLKARDEAAPDPLGAQGVMHLAPSVDREAFTAAIDRIHAVIAAGETYQVNYTYRLHGEAFGSPLALYRELRVRQPVAFGAFIALPHADAAHDGAITHVLSCSPELFLRNDAGLLTARPMKGTASRIAAPESDSETARMLSEDIKNRAENVMIVDLLRNDLGRVAQIGSVEVPSLFAIESYSTLFQMTSTVQARVKPEVGFTDLLRAVFPCGSITGAPKHHTMELIAGLESTPRGLYCGAIGWIDAPRDGARVGDFCLSVAIRTLVLGAQTRGRRPLTLGIGAGIVHDSVAADEFDECRLKARFLTGLDPGFALFETMRVDADGTIALRAHHLARLEASADALGFAYDGHAIDAAIDRERRSLAPGPTYRLRLALSHGGRVAITSAQLVPLPDGAVSLLLAPMRLPMHNPLSAHKTTLRAAYDEGVREAQRAGAFDSLFLDEEGRVVEGGRSSVFAKIDGRWWTPAVADGVLPGVMRGVLLADPAWCAAERTLTLQDLGGAEALMVCNALRGPLVAYLNAHSTVAA